MPEARVERETLNCPECNLHLRAIRHGGVHLDFCIECRGLWFDPGELDRIVGTDPLPSLPERPTDKYGRRDCPRDRTPLREQQLSRETLIDRCPQCGGVWLDRGEIQRFQRLAPRVGPALDTAVHLEFRATEAQRVSDDEHAAKQQETFEPKQGEWIFQFLTDLPREVYSPTRKSPLVTYGLIAASVLVFLIQWLVWVPGQVHEEDLFSRFGLVPNTFVHGLAPWTILTSLFMHADVWHLAGNMYFLAVFGDNVEDRLGVGQYMLLYLLGGIGATLVHVVTNLTSSIPVIGASGAISAVMGAYVFFFADRRIYMMIFFALRRIRAIWYLGLWLAIQIYFVAAGTPGVAWWAHIGGFAFGAAWAAVYRTRMRSYISSIEAAYGK